MRERREIKKIVLLRDNLDDILVVYDINISNRGTYILKKLVHDEKYINYKNLFFKSGNSIISNYDFLTWRNMKDMIF